MSAAWWWLHRHLRHHPELAHDTHADYFPGAQLRSGLGVAGYAAGGALGYLINQPRRWWCSSCCRCSTRSSPRACRQSAAAAVACPAHADRQDPDGRTCGALRRPGRRGGAAPRAFHHARWAERPRGGRRATALACRLRSAASLHARVINGTFHAYVLILILCTGVRGQPSGGAIVAPPGENGRS
jgi:hypothetical protein